MAPQSTVTIVRVVFGCYEDPQVQVPQPRIPNFRFKGFYEGSPHRQDHPFVSQQFRRLKDDSAGHQEPGSSTQTSMQPLARLGLT